MNQDRDARPNGRPDAAPSIRALIVDDEPLVRERIRTLLAEEADIEVVAECADGQEAVEAIEALAPDLMFLDIQMPVVDGFGVVETVGVERMPVVVFVTAYDQFALRAFETHALDYLLKPFDSERFARAVQHARATIQQRKSSDLDVRLRDLLGSLKPQSEYLERVVIRTGVRIVFLRIDEIDWMEAEGNYVRLHVGKKSHLLRETMSRLEARLDPASFLRIHRSTIVNIDRIKEMESLFHGEYVLVLHDGTKLTSSRGYRDRLRVLLEQSS
jgi:two-component system, LytTR family, response regulator